MGESQICNIYVDETCHLEHDGIPVMCIGYIKINRKDKQRISRDIRNIKIRHRSPTELKWNKLSYSRIDLYKELVDYFFDSPMEFRVVLVKNKDRLNNVKYNLSDNKVFYYKAAFYLLRFQMQDGVERRVYFDINERYSSERLHKISSILTRVCGTGCFTHFQNIRSEESDFIQLADFFIGAVSYINRDDIEHTSTVKMEVVEYIRRKTGLSLQCGTPSWQTKFNIFDFHLREE